MNLRLTLTQTYPARQVTSIGMPVERRIPELVQAFLRGERVLCSDCGKPITTGPLSLRGGTRAFHNVPCAERAAAREQRARTAAKVTAPQTKATSLAVLEGIACSFDRAGCAIPQPDGSLQHERFAADCFDSSLDDGCQQLLVNHTGAPLNGAFSRIAHDAGKLTFRFVLFDGPREQQVLDDVRRGQIVGCSIGFKPEASKWDVNTIEYTRARLLEISLLTDGKRPAWFGTEVTAAPL